MSPQPPLPQGLDGPEARPLLKTLHVMNADGTVSADMRRKLKQVAHLIELFRPTIETIASQKRRLRVIDANCGSSYLAFLLYHHATTALGVPVEVIGVDRDAGRVAASRERAALLGYEGMTFRDGAIADAELPEGADLLVSLHGCDTASDDAIKRAVALRVPHVHVAPCCQREVRGLIRPDSAFGPFLDDGIVAADFAATLTDTIRALWLRTRGYRSEIIEFVPHEHTAKNRLIRARYTKRRDERARTALDALEGALSAPPAILRGN